MVEPAQGGGGVTLPLQRTGGPVVAAPPSATPPAPADPVPLAGLPVVAPTIGPLGAPQPRPTVGSPVQRSAAEPPQPTSGVGVTLPALERLEALHTPTGPRSPARSPGAPTVPETRVAGDLPDVTDGAATAPGSTLPENGASSSAPTGTEPGRSAPDVGANPSTVQRVTMRPPAGPPGVEALQFLPVERAVTAVPPTAAPVSVHPSGPLTGTARAIPEHTGTGAENSTAPVPEHSPAETAQVVPTLGSGPADLVPTEDIASVLESAPSTPFDPSAELTPVEAAVVLPVQRWVSTEPVELNAMGRPTPSSLAIPATPTPPIPTRSVPVPLSLIPPVLPPIVQRRPADTLRASSAGPVAPDGPPIAPFVQPASPPGSPDRAGLEAEPAASAGPRRSTPNTPRSAQPVLIQRSRAGSPVLTEPSATRTDLGSLQGSTWEPGSGFLPTVHTMPAVAAPPSTEPAARLPRPERGNEASGPPEPPSRYPLPLQGLFSSAVAHAQTQTSTGLVGTSPRVLSQRDPAPTTLPPATGWPLASPETEVPVQRAAEPPAATPGEGPEAAPDPAPVGGPDTGPQVPEVARAVERPAGAPAPAAPGPQVLDVEDLARRLFDPLCARLKAELWLDRERAGLITELRR